jgi:TFIIF-interacting CTD phosphatase-like protein
MLKDLNVFQNIDLAKTVIVDNNVYSFAFQLDNGIPIVPFEGDKDDLELIKLMKYLVTLKDEADFRDLNKKTYGFS